MTQHLPFLLAILPPREGAFKQSSCGASPWRDMTRPSVKRQVALRVDGPALKVGQGAAAEGRCFLIVKSAQTPGIMTYPQVRHVESYKYSIPRRRSQTCVSPTSKLLLA